MEDDIEIGVDVVMMMLVMLTTITMMMMMMKDPLVSVTQSPELLSLWSSYSLSMSQCDGRLFETEPRSRVKVQS